MCGKKRKNPKSCFYLMYYIFRGLLGGHVAAKDLQSQGKCCLWYNNELLDKALELGERLLPAFNTSSGIPYPKVGGVDVILVLSAHTILGRC